MSNPTCVTLSGLLAGVTDQGALEQVNLDYLLDNQKAHVQMGVNVLTTDVAKAVALQPASAIGEPGNVQTLFFLKSSRKVDFTLNGGGPTYSIAKENGVLILSGSPEVVSIEFTGTAAATAKVHVTKIIGAP